MFSCILCNKALTTILLFACIIKFYQINPLTLTKQIDSSSLELQLQLSAMYLCNVSHVYIYCYKKYLLITIFLSCTCANPYCIKCCKEVGMVRPSIIMQNNEIMNYQSIS